MRLKLGRYFFGIAGAIETGRDSIVVMLRTTCADGTQYGDEQDDR
jgi:hypothetical protein